LKEDLYLKDELSMLNIWTVTTRLSTLLMLFLATSASADTYITLGGASYHVGQSGYTDDTGYNVFNQGNNRLIGVEIVKDSVGIGAFSFKNSYYEASSAIYGSKYWEINEHIKVGVLSGIVMGYEDWQFNNALLKISNKVHLLAAPTVKIEYANAYSQVSVFGNALTMAFGLKF
jgi:hypothetical protein